MDLDLLVQSSAALVVGAIATEAWSATKAGVVKLFGRGDSSKEASVENDLDRSHEAIAVASEADRSAVVHDHQAELRGWFRAQLRDDPELAEKWKVLAEELAHEIAGKAGSPGVYQVGTSRDNSTFIQVAGNNYGFPPKP